MYYVYIGYVNHQVMYIGKGKDSRFHHLNSGISTCYQANKAHFMGINITTKIACYLDTEEEAFELESLLIDVIQPPWNIRGNTAKEGNAERKVGMTSFKLSRLHDKLHRLETEVDTLRETQSVQEKQLREIMKQQVKSDWQSVALTMISQGCTHKEVAEFVGKSTKTIQRLLNK